MRSLLIAVSLAVLIATTGCHSAYIEATIANRTPQTLSLVELDYPSASFGTQNLAPGQDFHYRFKIIGSAPLKLLYTDSTHTDRSFTGPSLREPDEGTLTVTITPTNPTWSLHLLNRQLSTP